jgi:hypothetical protein
MLPRGQARDMCTAMHSCVNSGLMCTLMQDLHSKLHRLDGLRPGVCGRGRVSSFSLARGRRLTGATRRDWGGAPFVDMRAGWRALLDRYPEIDAGRAGALGGSWGGYGVNLVMCSWLASPPMLNARVLRFRATPSGTSASARSCATAASSTAHTAGTRWTSRRSCALRAPPLVSCLLTAGCAVLARVGRAPVGAGGARADGPDEPAQVRREMGHAAALAARQPRLPVQRTVGAR